MTVLSKEQRAHQRTRVNWRVEFKGTSDSLIMVHEGSRMEDYSRDGACFLTMSDVQVGMKLTLNITRPLRMTRPLVLKGEVVRVDDQVDVGGMFKAAAVRWLHSQQKSVTSKSRESQPASPSALSH